MKKQLIVFACLLLLLAACKTPKNVVKPNNTDRPNRYFPEVFGEIVFNMPLQDVVAKRPNLAPVSYVTDAFSFRKEFVEEVKDGGIQKAIYYFDADGTNIFYELVLVYESEEKRDAEAIRLLGQPNHADATEWMLESRQDFKVHAWKFENKLVLAALLPGTEWQEKGE